MQVRKATNEEASLMTEVEMALTMQTTVMQSMNGEITDGVIVCGIARLLGRIIAHQCPECREKIMENVKGIVAEYTNIELQAHQAAQTEALKAGVAGRA